MQLFIKSNKNKIFLTLTILLAIAAFIVIRECDYPLLIHANIIKKLFVSNCSEKLFYNLSLSYIVTYVYYIIQSYIPETVKEKKALHILSGNMDKELRLVKEFLYLINFVIKKDQESTILFSKNITPVFYKEHCCGSCMLRRFSEIDTLKSTMKDIIATHHLIESSRNYCDLSSYVMSIHTGLPSREMGAIIENIDYSLQTTAESHFTSDIDLTNIDRFINNMEKILPDSQKVSFEHCDDTILIQKYNNAFKALKLDEYRLAVTLNTNPYVRNK